MRRPWKVQTSAIVARLRRRARELGQVAVAVAAWWMAQKDPPFDMRDLCAFGGVACVGYGLALVYLPAAWVVCGIALFYLGVRR